MTAKAKDLTFEMKIPRKYLTNYIGTFINAIDNYIPI